MIERLLHEAREGNGAGLANLFVNDFNQRGIPGIQGKTFNEQ
jgi:hypothetical protein